MALPTTGFEDRNRDGAWTSFAEEATYRAALLDAVPEITGEVISQGSGGDDMWLYRIGTGSRHVLMVAQVHAAELSGRDALLSLIRDWATSTDQAIIDYLQQVTLLVIPTMRPDSMTSRDNPNGVNINRDYVQSTQPETQVVHQLIRDHHPVLAVDVHEGVNISNDYATSKMLNPNIHDDLNSLSGDLEQAVKSSIESGGWTWEAYQGHNITGPEFGHNAFGARHAVGLLLESRRSTLDNNQRDTRRRYLTQVQALHAAAAWHSAHFAEVSAAQDASRVAADSGLGQVELITGTSVSGPVVNPAPSGYRITGEDEATLDTVIDLYDLDITNSDGRVLSAKHDAAVMVHYLADQQSTQALVNGERYYGQHALHAPPHVEPSRPAMYYQMGGVKHVAWTLGGSVLH